MASLTELCLPLLQPCLTPFPTVSRAHLSGKPIHISLPNNIIARAWRERREKSSSARYMMTQGRGRGARPTAAITAEEKTSCSPSWLLAEHSTYLDSRWRLTSFLPSRGVSTSWFRTSILVPVGGEDAVVLRFVVARQ